MLDLEVHTASLILRLPPPHCVNLVLDNFRDSLYPVYVVGRNEMEATKKAEKAVAGYANWQTENTAWKASLPVELQKQLVASARKYAGL
jgi:hypothetical protein